MKKIALAIAAIASMSAGAAFAEGYVGAAVGSSHANVDCSGTTNCSTNSTGFKVFGGYKFSSNFAGEVSYFDYGRVKASVPFGGTVFDTTIKGSGLGIGIAFLGDFAPKWSGVARLGLASNRTKLSISGGGVSGSDSESSTHAYAGLGVGYEISKGVKLDAAFDVTNLKYSTESANMRLLSLGLTYTF